MSVEYIVRMGTSARITRQSVSGWLARPCFSRSFYDKIVKNYARIGKILLTGNWIEREKRGRRNDV